MKKLLPIFMFLCMLFGSHKAHAQIGPFCGGGNSSLVTYRNEVPYVTGNVVIYYGISYQATTSSTGQHPCTNGATNSAYWTTVIGTTGSSPGSPVNSFQWNNAGSFAGSTLASYLVGMGGNGDSSCLGLTYAQCVSYLTNSGSNFGDVVLGTGHNGGLAFVGAAGNFDDFDGMSIRYYWSGGTFPSPTQGAMDFHEEWWDWNGIDGGYENSANVEVQPDGTIVTGSVPVSYEIDSQTQTIFHPTWNQSNKVFNGEEVDVNALAFGSSSSLAWWGSIQYGVSASLDLFGNFAVNTTTGSVTSPKVNQEINGALYSTPELAVAAACSATSKEVYFPAGLYTVTTGMQACSGLHLRCAAPSLIGNSSTGTVFRLQSGEAVWGLSNPNSDVLSSGQGINSIAVDDCGFDVSQDSAALGAIRQKGIISSKFIGNTFYSNGNPNPVVTMDGGNFTNNSGDYDNTWVGNNFYDGDGGGGTDVGIYMTNTQTTGGSNNNFIAGGSISRYGTPILIDSGNNNSIIGVDVENFNVYGVHLTTNGGVGGAAGQNHFSNLRFEAASGTGIQVDSGSVGNSFENPYFSGVFTYFTDANANALNTCIGCFYGTDNINSTILTGLSSGSPYHNLGVGAGPNCLDGFQFNCLFVNGEISANRDITIAGNGGYSDFYSTATAHREIFIPDAGGSLLLTGGSIPLAPTSTATPSNNRGSNLLQFESSIFTGTVYSGSYTSGITATGSATQTCTLTSFNNGSTATATVALTGTNTIAAGTALVITSGGSGATSNPTSATAGSGTATCSGTATISTIAASNDIAQMFSAPQTGTNPSVAVVLEAGGLTTSAHTFNLWSFNGTLLQNIVAATSGQNQAAPYLEWLGAIWNGSASTADAWIATPTLGSGSNPTSTLVFSHTGSTGSASVQFPGIVLEPAVQSVGTKFTTSGCSVSSTTGGATAGKMTLGANTCSVVITMNGASGLTASNGWSCHANDETTAAGNTQLYFSANNATTATLSVPATAGTTDVVDFACTAF